MTKNKKPSYIVSVITNKCPCCRKGNLFTNKNAYNLKTTLQMPERCSVCNTKTEPEVGFYYGTGYVSYALSVGLMISVFVAWKILFGLSFSNNSVIWCLVAAIALLILLQPILMRLSRSLWLSWFVKYEENDTV